MWYLIVGFIVGYTMGAGGIYIGSNKEKYESACLGILLKETV